MNNLLSINKLSKEYYSDDGITKALDNIDLSIDKNNFYSIVGPSGCGKSTLLNIIAELDNLYTGTINKQDNLTIGYMLQKDALLPWLTIKDNCNLSMFLNNKKDDKKLNNYLKKYHLIDFANKYPYELSGGMRQRCALIRTLLLNPDILLLDEPFSQLDYQTRLKVEEDIYNIIKKENKTVILVTHDIEEAIAMSNKVIILSKRPAHIKDIIDINIDKTPINRRKDNSFNFYFNKIWNELDDL